MTTIMGMTLTNRLSVLKKISTLMIFGPKSDFLRKVVFDLSVSINQRKEEGAVPLCPHNTNPIFHSSAANCI